MGLIVFAHLCSLTIKYLLTCLYVVSANLNIHENMLKSLIQAPPVYFEKTPSGRILNRFSNDLGIMD